MTATNSDLQTPIPPRRAGAYTITELMAKPALTLNEAGKVLDVSKDLLLKLINAGTGPRSFYIGRVIYIQTEDLRAWLARLAAQQALQPHDPAG